MLSGFGKYGSIRDYELNDSARCCSGNRPPAAALSSGWRLVNLIALADNWRVARWLIHLAHPYSEANGREWIARVRQAHEGGRPREFAVALKDSDRLIGYVGIDGSNIGDSQGAAELGYWLGEPFWGKGYAREAVAAIII